MAELYAVRAFLIYTQFEIRFFGHHSAQKHRYLIMRDYHLMPKTPADISGDADALLDTT